MPTYDNEKRYHITLIILVIEVVGYIIARNIFLFQIDHSQGKSLNDAGNDLILILSFYWFPVLYFLLAFVIIVIIASLYPFKYKKATVYAYLVAALFTIFDRFFRMVFRNRYFNRSNTTLYR